MPFLPSPDLMQNARRALALPDSVLLRECEVEVFIGSGPGGQHRNKTESAVRIHHIATGLTAFAAERRSQLQNKSAALRRLREKLARITEVPKVRRPTLPTHASVERRLRDKKLASLRRKERQLPGDF